jgi:hypothetical protein
MIRLVDLAALDAWVTDRDELDPAAVVAVRRTPAGDVVIRLDVVVRAGYEPGTIEFHEIHELVAEAPAEFEVRGRNELPWWIDDVEVEELDGRLVLRIGEWPERLTLTAAAFRTARLAVGSRRVAPFVDGTTAVWPARDDRYWSERLTATLGEPVVWRVIGGPIARATGEDPDGCFLQRASALATSTYGVFCGQSTWTRLARHADTDDELWQAVRAVAAESELIRSGNCEFNSADWAAYLAAGVFPPDERLRRRR